MRNEDSYSDVSSDVDGLSLAAGGEMAVCCPFGIRVNWQVAGRGWGGGKKKLERKEADVEDSFSLRTTSRNCDAGPRYIEDHTIMRFKCQE